MKLVAFVPVIFLSGVAVAQDCPTKDSIKNKPFTVTFDNNNREVHDRNSRTVQGQNTTAKWSSNNCVYPLGCTTSYTNTENASSETKMSVSLPIKNDYLKKPGDRISFLAVEEQTQQGPNGDERYLFKYWVTSSSLNRGKIKVGACEYDVLINQSVRELIEPGDFELYRETNVLYSPLLEMPLKSEVTQISNGKKTQVTQTVVAIDF